MTPIGIDFGTSSSEIVAFLGDEAVPILDPRTRSPLVMPSQVALADDGQLVVGFDAVPYVGTESCVREVKRKMGSAGTIPLGERSFKPEEIAALIIQRLKEFGEEALGQVITDVVLSVPANFADNARQATLRAANLAGLSVLRLLNEPTAAAIAFGQREIHREDQIVVFDFGGGTLDVSVVEMMEGVLDTRSSYGDPELGGKDIDDAVVRFFVERIIERGDVLLPTDANGHLDPRCMALLRAQAEWAKIALSDSMSVRVDLRAVGTRLGVPATVELELTRADLESAIAPVLNRARDCLRKAMLQKDIRPSGVSQVLLVGGTTRIPAVRNLVIETLAREPRSDVDPIMAVATGASIWAATMSGMIPEEERVVMTDVSPFGLGVEVIRGSNSQVSLSYEPLILPNETIPTVKSRRYSLQRVDQTRLEVTLLQDHDGSAKLSREAIPLAKGIIDGIEPSRTGIPRDIDIEFSYDLNGVVQVRARIPSTGQEVQVRYATDVARPQTDTTPGPVAPGASVADDAGLDDGWKGRMERAESLIREAPLAPDVAAKLRGLVNALREAIARGEVVRAREIDISLTDALFEVDFWGTP